MVVISQKLADRYWPGADPIGQRLTFARTSRSIVGVVGDVRQSLIRFSESAQMTVYVPIAQQAAQSVVLVARASGDAEALRPQLRQDLSSFDSRLTVGQIQTMEQIIARFNVGLNLFNVILGGFGFLALLLAAIGTYGVLAYDVAQRSHEIGVRLAMGSPRSRLLRLFLKQGLVLDVIGLAIGTPGVIAIAIFRPQSARRLFAVADVPRNRRGDNAVRLDAGREPVTRLAGHPIRSRHHPPAGVNPPVHRRGRVAGAPLRIFRSLS